MTTIALPNHDANEALNTLAKTLFIDLDKPDQTKLRKFVNIVDEEGKTHTANFDQLEYLINVLDLSRPFDQRMQPQLYLMHLYNIEGLVELGEQGWVITDYQIHVKGIENKIVFSGILVDRRTLVKHPDYDPNVTVGSKEFEFELTGFDLIQQYALSRCIAQQDEQFAHAAGTFNFNYIYKWAGGQVFLGAEELVTNE